MRILEVSGPKRLSAVMKEINVDPYGIKIMVPKGLTHLLRINSLSNISANILKQEMLSFGADAAIARGALTGKTKKTDCLLIGNLAQFQRLNEKLKKQPFGLDRLSGDIDCALKNYHRDNFIFKTAKFKLYLSRRPHIMGILNITPDSFSADGLYGKSIEEITDAAQRMVAEGADIIDVGGESSRPGADKVSLEEEIKRTIPVIKRLSKELRIPISIDTYKPRLAQQALDNGASIVNDISGLRDAEMLKTVSNYKAGVVVMHMRGRPKTMQNNPKYKSLLDDIINYLNNAINKAIAYGIDKDRIILDPGIGFGKTVEHNLEILNRLKEFKVLGMPILVGPSRKSFIGRIANVKIEERLYGTISACVTAVNNGAHIVRVHDIKEVKQALIIAQSINKL